MNSSVNLPEFSVASVVENIQQPRIGLLNIGSEEMKGNDTIRQAASLLSDSGINYIGFVEGSDIARQKADVVVCDGFSGNVALKLAALLRERSGVVCRLVGGQAPAAQHAGLRTSGS